MIPEQLLHRLWHATSADETLHALEGRPEGLREAEVAERRALFGENSLPKPRGTSLPRLYGRQFTTPLIYLLFAAAAVSVAIGEWTDAGFIFAVLQINAVIGVVQEWHAESNAMALNMMIRNWVVTRRDGRRHRLDSRDLVPGDIVILEPGGKVPADIRLIRALDLRTDESLLTGESLPVEKDAEVVLPEQTVTGDRHNMLHAGSTVVAGRAEGIVTHTGMHTEIGRIAQALARAGATPPPLIIRLKTFTNVVSAAVVSAVAVIAVVEWAMGTPFAEIFLVSVALVVSAIPEGLPVAITVALSVGCARMARRKVIVRSLPAVEGLGACTLIASDKTGTLTCNELTAKRLYVPGMGDLEVTGQGYHLDGAVTGPDGLADGGSATLRRLATSGALCNEATFRQDAEGIHHFGDTVDVAFLVLAGKIGLSRESLLADHPEMGAVPFEPHLRFAATFNRSPDGPCIHVKGAAETVLPMCADDVPKLLVRAEDLAADGFRVIAVATGPVPGVLDAASVAGLRGLTFLGLVGLIDPLRPEVAPAVDTCRRAGIDVRVVTGDHPATAFAIGRQLGLARTRDQVVTGAELADMANDPAELGPGVESATIFARVEPIQKLTIVQACQANGHFVAVTGDGVNDAPALRAANIGVAMGKEGTDVARGASDLIIVDDNFASIVSGVEEGRIAYDNVRKVIYLLISTGAAEVVMFFLSLLAGLPLPLFAVQLLWLNLITNGIQHVGLAFEKGEHDVLLRHPRPPRQGIFDRVMIEQTVISGLTIGILAFLFFQWAIEGAGMDEFSARNALLLLMVLFENVHVFNCRSERRSAFRVPLGNNLFLVSAVIVAQSIHVACMYLPGVRDVLRLQPVSLDTWLEIAAIALSVVAVMEVYKFVGRRLSAAAAPLTRP